MQKKSIIIALFIFIAVLFLLTIGNGFVGYSIYDQQYTELQHYPYPFIKNNNYNSLYIVIPQYSTLTEKQSAQKIAKSLQLTKPIAPKIVKPSELPQGNYNLILIGDACTNDLIKSFLNQDGCTLGLKKEQGLIKLLSGKKSILIISGYDLKSLDNAASVLANYGSFPLTGTDVIVQGNSDNIYSLSLIEN